MTRSRNPLIILGEMRGYLLGVGLVLCLMATAVVFMPQPQKANAFPNRLARYGYFTNQYDGGRDGNKVIQNGGYNNGLDGVDSLNDVTGKLGFISRIRDHLNGLPATSITAKNDQIGAAFIILDMLQFPPDLTSPYTDRSIAEAQAQFANWEAGIRNASSINFNFFQFPYITNTYYQIPSTSTPATTGDIAWVSQSGNFDAIVIYWGDGSHYAIKKICGNPVGDSNTKGIPNYLKVKHVDENNIEMVSSSSNFINKIVCSTDFFGNCTASRGGSSYTIELASGKYTVTNTGVPLGYEYTGYTLTLADGRVVTNTNSAVTSLIFDTIPQKPFTNIVWRYKKILGNNCKDIVPPPVGIGETATLESTIATGNLWTPLDGFVTVLSSTTAQQFKLSYGTAGNYQVKLRVNSVDSICWVVVTQKPYIRAYGGDIFAGSSGCDLLLDGWEDKGGNAGIYGFMGTAGIGSGAQLGVLAMGQIWDFNSAMLRTTAPAPPNGLTFGNTTSPPGNLSVGRCPYDYWGKKTITSNNVGISPISLSTYIAGEYYAGSTISINSTTIPNSKVINLYVNGDLVILQNIIYQNASGATAWTSVDQIPRLQIVVKGNIYIAKDVTQLDGVYVAQGGTIYTCANGTSLYSATTLYTNCNKQLLVNGALLATKIKWLRTFGNLADSFAAENPSSGNRSCTSAVNDPKPTCASEVVNLGPEAWMVGPSSTSPTADYVQALPPLL